MIKEKTRPREAAKDFARSAKESVAGLDVKWAHGPVGDAMREAVGRFFFSPVLTYYTRRRIRGRENLDKLDGPVVLVANHASHMDTPAILRALPRRLRRRTVVGAAADYFYRNRFVATAVSVLFNTVPMQRRGGGLSEDATAHIDRLLKRGNNLLLYPEGTRSRDGGVGRLRQGATAIAAKHGAAIVPIYIRGTRDAMPPGRRWPRRLRGGHLRRYQVTIEIGKPINPPAPADRRQATEAVARFFEQAARQLQNRRAASRRWRRRRAHRFRR